MIFLSLAFYTGKISGRNECNANFEKAESSVKDLRSQVSTLENRLATLQASLSAKDTEISFLKALDKKTEAKTDTSAKQENVLNM